MNNKLKLAVLASIVLTTSQSLMAYEHHQEQAVISKSIVSGNGWLVTTTPGAACPATACRKWTDIGYDDSKWEIPVVSDNNGGTTIKSVLPGTKAHFMWYPSTANEAYFRYKFTLNSSNKTLPLLAEAFVEADDYLEVWVNGNFVTSGNLADHLNPTTGKWNPQIADMTPYLQDGQNVIAIRANDGDCKQRDPGTGRCFRIPDNGESYSRVYKNVFFDGIIKTVGK
jgi:hypothetical protein